VLVIASSRSRTFAAVVLRRNPPPEILLRRDAETSTRDACAPRTLGSGCQELERGLLFPACYLRKL
jgi:hypothetical protein